MSASAVPHRADKYGLPTTNPSGAGMPAPVVAFTAAPAAYHGPSTPAVLAQRKQHLSDGQYHFYKSPLMLVEGRMQYCFDENGRQFLDAYSNVCHIGHAHPAYVRRVQDAVSAIASNTRYLHPTIVEYAGRLKQKLPPKLDVVYFVNSGSEANDLAMRLARVFTKKNKVACFRGAYHGTTMTCTGVSTSLSTGTTEGSADLAYCARDVVVIPCPDPYRGPHRATDAQCADKYVADAVEALAPHRTDVAAFIAESVQGVGGQIVYPEGYMQKMSAHIRANGGVTIADEVQTGFGRSGTHFWAFETQGVVPDIVVMGKPIGNGFPLGCVATTREIATAFDSAQYFNTFGGNPVACAAGLAVLDVIERDRLQERALHVSGHWMRQLAGVRARHPLVGDVRGVGLFLGIELVRDRETLEPAPEETALAMELCRAYGVLVGKGGVHNNVLRIKPPLCFGQEDADFATTVLDRVFAEIERDPVAAAASIGLTWKATAKPRRPAVSSAAAAAEVLAAPPVSVVHCGKPVRRERDDEVALPAFMNISPSPTMRRKAELPPPGLDVTGTPSREVQRMLASPTTGTPNGDVSAQRLRALQECVAATLQQQQ